jgi:hypothetical protein
MNQRELDAYDYGCSSHMAALNRILDGKDSGHGVANEPWESARRKILALMANQITAQQVEPVAWLKAAEAALEIMDELPVWQNAGYACQLLRDCIAGSPAAQPSAEPLTDEAIRMAMVLTPAYSDDDDYVRLIRMGRAVLTAQELVRMNEIHRQKPDSDLPPI